MPTKVPTLVLNDTRVDDHHGCSRVMMNLTQLLASNGCSVIASVPAHVEWESDASVLAIEGRTRLVVVNGEGTIHHDRAAGARLLRAGAWARERGVPAVLLNASWEANGPEALSRLRDFSLVAVRDNRSAAAIGGQNARFRVVPDLSLYQPWAGRKGVDQGIAFTDSVERATTIQLDRLRRSMRAVWLPIQEDTGGLVDRLAFVRGGVSRSDVRAPRMALEMARARWSLACARFASVNQFLWELSRHSLLVSGRFHACTLAMIARTPFISVPSNTAKIQALIEDSGLAPWRCLTDLSQEHIKDAARAGWGTGELSKIEDYLEFARAAVDGLMNDVRSLI